MNGGRSRIKMRMTSRGTRYSPLAGASADGSSAHQTPVLPEANVTQQIKVIEAQFLQERCKVQKVPTQAECFSETLSAMCRRVR